MPSKEQVLASTTIVFRDILKKDNLKLNRNSTAADIEGWDSWAHINIIVSIEKNFNIRFSADEASSLKNIGELIDLIMKKTK